MPESRLHPYKTDVACQLSALFLLRTVWLAAQRTHQVDREGSKPVVHRRVAGCLWQALVVMQDGSDQLFKPDKRVGRQSSMDKLPTAPSCLSCSGAACTTVSGSHLVI